jgi:dephospho-CoA kinase
MIKVGLTGNIGSGKTTVLKIFETLGVPVFYADNEAKKFLSHPDVISWLQKDHGKEVLKDGTVDRNALAELVFNDEKLLKQLNALIHPLVRKAFFSWADQHQQHPYIIQEAAILFESGFDQFFDKIILVTCTEEIAVARVMKRDGITEFQVKKRLQNQMAQEDKIPKSDYLISNNENEMVLPQVLKIHWHLSSSNSNS